MNSKWFRRLSIVVLGTLLGGTLFVSVLAMGSGRLWAGENYWHQPIPALLQFVVVSFLIGFGLYWLARNWRWWL